MVPYKKGNNLGTIKVTYLLDKIFIVFDTFTNDLKTRNIEFVVRDIHSGAKLNHYMSVCEDVDDATQLEFDFYLAQQFARAS